MSNQAPEPVAWMRDDGEGSIATTTDVITKRVRDIWLKANPKQIERYTIELYLATPTAAQIRAEELERLRGQNQDWSMLEASQASLREHMQEIHTLRELVREALRRHVWSPEWDERAVKALEGK